MQMKTHQSFDNSRRSSCKRKKLLKLLQKGRLYKLSRLGLIISNQLINCVNLNIDLIILSFIPRQFNILANSTPMRLYTALLFLKAFTNPEYYLFLNWITVHKSLHTSLFRSRKTINRAENLYR